MTPRNKSSLDNSTDIHIHSESVTVRPNQTEPQAGEKEPSTRCTRSLSYQEALHHWKPLEKWKRHFFSTKCHRLFIYIRSSPSGLPSIQYRGQALLKHRVLPHPYENWFLAGNQYTCFNIYFWKIGLIHMYNFL